MKMNHALLGFGLLTAAYVGVLVGFDQLGPLADHFANLVGILPPVAALVLSAVFARYLRWLLLLRHFRRRVSFGAGLLAYLAGFSMTLSPGKLGELVRIRYFVRLGVAPEEVLACFIVERTTDLIAVFILAALVASQLPGFAAVATVTAVVLAAVIAFGRSPQIWRQATVRLRRMKLHLIARWIRLVGRALSHANAFRPAVMIGALIIAFIAYGLQSLGFVYLLDQFGVQPPLSMALGLFPAASIIGSGSMIPAGIGLTESASVLLLRGVGSPLHIAVVATVGMRLCSLWMLIALGLCTAAGLELAACAPLAEGSLGKR